MTKKERRQKKSKAKRENKASKDGWIALLNKVNEGHSSTIFGIIVDENGKPITGKV